jgi:hypothetical protein|tara:strand:- start:1446 stop:1613 length:168 start_codon:yes stop_codon:yes gene_type:complete
MIVLLLISAAVILKPLGIIIARKSAGTMRILEQLLRRLLMTNTVACGLYYTNLVF